jgi:hypothetical protein
METLTLAMSVISPVSVTALAGLTLSVCTVPLELDTLVSIRGPFGALFIV